MNDLGIKVGFLYRIYCESNKKKITIAINQGISVIISENNQAFYNAAGIVLGNSKTEFYFKGQSFRTKVYTRVQNDNFEIYIEPDSVYYNLIGLEGVILTPENVVNVDEIPSNATLLS
ncbi:hypothetical protein I6E11_03530 [Bacteroides caecigallinarum]|uniref:hypothetical protein n=1 Tax=Bacteroides caecigallinarum TaxID=1411144 RepID=UPI001F35C909|nr:hypothetical protein [Bacteroides caecigallinarum]MCF2592889.1 hypothetical protein [Bacteroides caecigallinarum]